MTDKPARNRCPVHHVHETVVMVWTDLGWTVTGPSDAELFFVVQWDGAGPPVYPERDPEADVILGAVASLERERVA
jgi:hypothetical protein